MDRNKTIDVLKGISILCVVLTHYAWTQTERNTLLFPFWIDMAVPMFMILSGYVYTESYVKREIESFEEAYNIKGMFTKSIRFLLPFTIIYILEIYLASFDNYHYPLKQIYNAFLCGGFGPGSYYVPLMIQFLFVFPVIYFVIKKYQFKGLLLCGLVNGVYEILQSAYGMNEQCYRLLLFRYILVISFGCYLALGIESSIKASKAVISFLVGFIFILLCCYLNYTPKIIVYWTRTSFVACLYILPIAALLLKLNMRCKLLECLGRTSYDIYLIQMVYYFIGADHIYGMVKSRELQLVFSLVICCMGGILFNYIERPITRRLMRVIENVNCELK